MMTSNLGSDVMTAMGSGDEPADPATVLEAVRPILSNHFKPALLARMTIVPFFPLSPDTMREIVVLKLGHLQRRMQDTHRIELEIGDPVVDQITARCTEVETGARNIDHIMTRTLLPLLSQTLLSKMSTGAPLQALTLDVDAEGEYTLSG
jgi:type VI secretion system protein VasG